MSDVPQSDKPQGTYVPLTEKEVEEWRAHLLSNWQLPLTKQGAAVLCDMAISSLRYAEEIQRLRDTSRSSVAGYEMTATRVELTRRAQSIIGSMRSIYEVPESMIDELRRLDEAFHAPRSARGGFTDDDILALTRKMFASASPTQALREAMQERGAYVSGGSGG